MDKLERGKEMSEYFKTYYLKNGRLDLSLLEGQKEEIRSVHTSSMSNIYMDENISSILEEMGNCFLEEEKNS